jgi:hypothetical protein
MGVVSDGVYLGTKYPYGDDAPISWWHSANSQPLLTAHTGDICAWLGVKAHGSVIDVGHAASEPLDATPTATHTTAVAPLDGSVGSSTSAEPGTVATTPLGGSAGGSGSVGPGAIDTGGNSAGNGGDGYFFGSMVHAPVVIYAPINIAVAGYNSSAHADQTNHVTIDQSAFQMAGVGGDGGNGNAASGGNVSGSGGSSVIASGDNHAGNGGDGYFYGGLVHASFALYYPINIAVAGYNSSAHADQTNNVTIDQSAFQMAGVGGDGGNGNTAAGGTVGMSPSIFDLIGSDVIATGHNGAGNGGDGHFAGSLVDVNVAIYAPINIAVAGYNSTAEAHQSNDLQLDQSTTQIAGIGGDGGHGNTALGGDLAMHLLSDLHLLDHA